MKLRRHSERSEESFAWFRMTYLLGGLQMENIKTIARKFIEQCDFASDIDAVFLTGSHAVGNADEHSDIDLWIVLNDSVTWRERGTKRIDGFLVEYFANPMGQIKRNIDFSFNNVAMTEINMILSGIVMINKNDAVEKLRNYCLQKDLTNFPALEESQVKLGLLRLWDNFDELTRAYKSELRDFALQYNMFVTAIFDVYSKLIGSPVPTYKHMYRWLTDEKYSTKFGLPAYNDPTFLEMIVKTFGQTDIDSMYTHAESINNYVFEKANDFDVDNFVLRSQCY
jgi:predicted nucleotidyltransferase